MFSAFILHIAVIAVRVCSFYSVFVMMGRPPHCCVHNQLGVWKSCNSLTHRSCTGLGRDVLSVNYVVFKTRSLGDSGVIGSSEGLPANVFHWWFLSFLSLPIFFKMHICELNWYVWKRSVFHVSSPRFTCRNLRSRRIMNLGLCWSHSEQSSVTTVKARVR